MQDAVVGPDGARIRWVEIAGAEPARACVHGAGAQAAAYFTHAMTLPPLAGRRTLMMDLLGFGLSDRPAGFGYRLDDHADALARALDSAGITDAEVIGHSMGGAVTIALASAVSTNVHRVSGNCCGSSPDGRATPHRVVGRASAGQPNLAPLMGGGGHAGTGRHREGAGRLDGA